MEGMLPSMLPSSSATAWQPGEALIGQKPRVRKRIADVPDEVTRKRPTQLAERLKKWMHEDSVQLFTLAVQKVKQRHEELAKAGQMEEADSEEIRRTLFRLARRARTFKNVVPMCSLLIDELGISVNIKDRRSRQSPIFYASSVGSQPLVHFFLERKADANHLDFNLQTPLFYAARAGHADCVRSLMEGNASLGQADVNSQTAAFYAAGSGHLDCLSLLLTDVEAKRKDKYGRTALFYVADSGSCSLLLKSKCHIEECDKKGWTALFAAVAARREAGIKGLLDLKASIDVMDNSGMSLQTLARRCRIDLACPAKQALSAPAIKEKAIQLMEYRRETAAEYLRLSSTEAELPLQLDMQPSLLQVASKTTVCPDEAD